MLFINCPMSNRPQLDDKSPPLKSALQKDLKERVVFAKLVMRASPLLLCSLHHFTILAEEALFVYRKLLHPKGGRVKELSNQRFR